MQMKNVMFKSDSNLVYIGHSAMKGRDEGLFDIISPYNILSKFPDVFM